MESSVRSRIVIDLEAVRHNVRFLCSLLRPGVQFVAAVKADAYGHGAIPVARAALAAGAWGLAVATAEEALELRECGIDAPVLVMGPLFSPGQLAEMARHHVDVALVSTEMVRMLLALPAGPPALRVHLKVDTGMNRQGLRPGREVDKFVDVARSHGGVRVVGVMTHFASAADEPDSVPWQLARLGPVVERVRSVWPGLVVHAANSAATMRHPEAHLDMVRCGIATYGLSPFMADALKEGLRPVMTWSSQVVMTKTVARGEGVGYGLTFRPATEHVVALVPVGYADGVFRVLGNRGEVVIRGRRRPMVGRVSMDSFAVDLGENSDGVSVGDEVTLIGRQGVVGVTAEEVAAWAGTINYEITCGVRTRRAERVFVHEGLQGNSAKGAERSPRGDHAATRDHTEVASWTS